MPNIKSAIKRVKVSETKNLQNRIVKTKVKTAVKKFEIGGRSKPSRTPLRMYGVTTSAIDKAVTKGVIHKNAANRKKARLAKQAGEGAISGLSPPACALRMPRRQVETEWKAMPCDGFARFLLFYHANAPAAYRGVSFLTG